MRTIRHACTITAVVTMLVSCQTAEEAFVGDRLLSLCDESYSICGKPSGCVLDGNHFAESAFPGTTRVVVATDDAESSVSVRLFLSKMESPGTQLIVQLYEPDCSLETNFARASLEDVDIFKEAGDDRTLLFDFKTFQEGEHLLEIFSDASAEFLLIAQPD